MFKAKQDVQVHTNFSDGLSSLDETTNAFIDTGIESIVITDHARGWRTLDGRKFEFFPTIDKYENYLNQIQLAKDKYKDEIKILAGLEIEIDIDGEFKLDKGILDYVEKFKTDKMSVDVLLGVIHSESFEEDCQQRSIDSENKRNTLLQNVINLVMNKNIDVFAHPFQAVHGHFSNNFTQDETRIILESIMSEQVAEHDIFLEINGKRRPHYEQWSYNKYKEGELKTQDLLLLRQYKDVGGKFVLGSDTHDIRNINNVDFSAILGLGLTESDIHIFK